MGIRLKYGIYVNALTDFVLFCIFNNPGSVCFSRFALSISKQNNHFAYSDKFILELFL